MATPYLDLSGFRSLTVMPAEFIDDIERTSPGWIAAQCLSISANIDARLRKRYKLLPFAAPYPDAVQSWLARLLTVRCAMRRGVDPNDLQFADYRAEADIAAAEIKEAADGELGLFDLPIAAGGDAQNSGIALGGPRVYSEQSPYVFTNMQECAGRGEDRNGSGSFG